MFCSHVMNNSSIMPVIPCIICLRERRASESDEPHVERILVLTCLGGMLDEPCVETVHLFDRCGRHLQVIAVLNFDAQQLAQQISSVDQPVIPGVRELGYGEEDGEASCAS